MKINKTTQRTLHVLEYIARHPRGVKLSELSTALNAPKSSIFDIVSTLTYMDYLRKHDSLFYIGFKAREVGHAYAEKKALQCIAEPILTKASAQYSVSSSLVLLTKNKLEYNFQAHPHDAVMVARQSCEYNFLHASAAGKIFLAHMPRKQCLKLLEKLTLHRFTDRTITIKKKLLQSIDEVKKQGYALDNREFHYLLQCVAAPVYARKKVIAVISFSGLNLYNDTPQTMITRILHTAKEISQKCTGL